LKIRGYLNTDIPVSAKWQGDNRFSLLACADWKGKVGKRFGQRYLQLRFTGRTVMLSRLAR